MPLISVIMTVFNEEKHLDNAVESVLNQDLSDFELLLVDDHSTDGSFGMMQTYRELDDRVVVLRTPTNGGPARARNLGLEKAQGKYVAILDADDINMPGRLKTQYAYMEEHREVYLAGGNLVLIDGDDREVNVWKSGNYRPEDVQEVLPIRNCIAHSSVMFRNSGEFTYREKFEVSEEYDLYLNLLTACKRLANIPLFLVKYRLRPESLTFQQSEKIHLYAEKAREFYGQRLRGGKDKYQNFSSEDLPVLVSGDFAVSNRINLALKVRDYALALNYLREYKREYGKSPPRHIYLLLRIHICKIKQTAKTSSDYLRTLWRSTCDHIRKIG